MTCIDKAIKAHRIARKFWGKACAFDGIPASSMFVMFSDNNPYVSVRNRAMSLYFSFLRGG